MYRFRHRLFLLGLVLLAATSGWLTVQFSSEANSAPPAATEASEMARPQYTPDGALLRPTGYERWVVVGTSIGLSYAEGAPADPGNPGQFHNVYVQPQSFDHFVQTGEFPEQTVFVVTNNPSQSTRGKDQLNQQGYFAAPTTGLEVAVKDSKRFADGWAYFMFHDEPSAGPRSEQGEGHTAEKAFERAACFDCHAEHGQIDNVFTQFYSVLTTARARHLAQSLK